MQETFFVCDKCDCLDSTISGTFTSKGMLPREYSSKNLCCACAPVYDINGRPIAGNGRWHGRFTKRRLPLHELIERRSTIAYFGRFGVDVDLAVKASELSACPNCGSGEIAVARSVTYGAVICLQCGMAGTRSATIDGATKAWNDGVG